MGYQQITIMGNLTRDLEVRPVGQSQVAKTGIAVSEKFRKQDGTIGESTEFFDIEIWDKASVYPYLTKGASVLVVGQQKTNRWQDQNGQNREAKKIRVQVIQLCGGRPQQQGQQAAPAAPAPAPAPAPTPAPATVKPTTYQQAPYPPKGQPMPGYAPVSPAQQLGFTPGPPPAAPQYAPQAGDYRSGDQDLPF